MSIFNSLKLRTIGEAGRYAFRKGYGGPLLFIWILGAGVLAVYLEQIFLALLWTVAVFAIFFFLVRDYLKNPKSEKEILREAVEGYFDGSESGIENVSVKQELKKAQQVYAELVSKIREMIKAKGSGGLERIVDNANTMIALQLESARQVDEFERFLSIVDDRRTQRTSSRSKQSELLAENVRLVQMELEKSKDLVFELTDKLQTLLLQMPQIERNAGDIVEADDIEKNLERELARIQLAIRACKETVKKFAG